MDATAKENQIAEALNSIGVDAAPSQLSALRAYLEDVLETNAQFNLTAVREWDDAVWLHIVDSLTAIREVQDAPRGALADLGSGAGFPGIALAVATGRETTLVESVRKKARFVEHASAGFALPITVYGGRAEELAADSGPRFSVVTARALASLPSLVELASPLLVEGGILVAYKGTPDEAEVSRGAAAAALAGMRQKSRRELVLPGPVPSARTILAYERCGAAATRLPRRIGLAQREPLA